MPAIINGFNAGASAWSRGLQIRQQREELGQRREESKFDQAYKERVLKGQQSQHDLDSRIAEINFQEKRRALVEKRQLAEDHIMATDISAITMKSLQSEKDPDKRALILADGTMRVAGLDESQAKILHSTGLEYIQRTSPFQATPIPGTEAMAITGGGLTNPSIQKSDTGSSFRQLINERNTAFDSGNVEETKLYDARIAKEVASSGMRISTNPDGTFTFEQGALASKDPSALTVGTKSKLEQEALSGQTSISELGRSIELIKKSPLAIGPTGIVLSAVETAKGILDPFGDDEMPITATRDQLTFTFTQIAAALRVDSGNMSLYERKQLERAGDVTKLWTAPREAKDKFQNLKRAVIAKQMRNYKARNLPIAVDILAQVEESEFEAMLTSGLITANDARRWYQLQQR